MIREFTADTIDKSFIGNFVRIVHLPKETILYENLLNRFANYDSAHRDSQHKHCVGRIFRIEHDLKGFTTIAVEFQERHFGQKDYKWFPLTNNQIYQAFSFIANDIVQWYPKSNNEQFVLRDICDNGTDVILKRNDDSYFTASGFNIVPIDIGRPVPKSRGIIPTDFPFDKTKILYRHKGGMNWLFGEFQSSSNPDILGVLSNENPYRTVILWNNSHIEYEWVDLSSI